jgi:protein KRI1
VILVHPALEALDLDGDWDAEAYDQQMAAVLAETDGVGPGGDDEKPAWDDDIDIGDIVPPSLDKASHASASAAKERRNAKKKERKKSMRDEASAVDVDEMDADAPTNSGRGWDEVEWDGTEEMRKRVLDQYMEELYDLEFNDMVRPPSPSPPFPHSSSYARDSHPLRLQECPHTSAMSL